MVADTGVASNSRGILLLGAAAMIAAAAGVSATQGTGWIIPMAILLSVILGILSFSMLTVSKEKESGSTPLSIKTNSNDGFIEQSPEDLPDPNTSGFELPIM